MKHEKDYGFFEKIKRKISDFFYGISVKLHKKSKEKDFAAAGRALTAGEKKKARAKELVCIWSFLVIPIIDLCIFWVYGTIQSFPIAFEHHFNDGSMKYDFYNFEYLFQTISEPGSIFLQSLVNTLKYFSFALFVLTPLSFIMGYFLYKKVAGYKFFRYVFFLPSIVSSVITAAFFWYIFGPGGQIPYLFEKLFGLKDVMFFADSKYAFKTLLFYNFYLGLTSNLIYWLAAFARIPEEIVEAGKIDGLSTMKEFRYIAFPLVLPFFSTMLLLMFTGILGAGGPALLLTGGAYGTYDLPFYLYKYTVSGTISDQGIAGAVGLVQGAVILPFTLIINKLVKKIEPVEY